MQIYRINKETDEWLKKAYGYVRTDAFCFGQNIPVELEFAGEEAQDDLRANKNLGVYKGALYENFVAESFTKQNIGLYYYNKDNSTLEEDFFVRTKNSLVPVEVKSNSNQSKSLLALVKNSNYSDIKFGIKFGDNNVGFGNNIYTFPYFCVFMISKFLKTLD